MRKIQRKRKARLGVAAVEAAVCLPMVLVLVLGSVELSHGIFQQHVVRSAVHETTKIALRGNATVEDCQRVCSAVIEQRGFEPEFSATLEIVPRGTPETNVNVDSIPADRDDVAANFPLTFTDENAPDTRIDLPRGFILRLTVTTPRPDIALQLTPSVLPTEVVATAVFVKGL